MSLYSMIQATLSQSCYSDFSDLESTVLGFDKHNSLEAALKLALQANDIGEAFMVGYRCALQALLPDLKQDAWAAMCVSEKEGNHPKLIKTTIDESGVVNGHKSFITMADKAKQLIVLGKAGEKEGRPLLKAVLIEQPSSGVSIDLMPALPMVPNVRHGQIQFDNSQGQLLAGDGYSDYSKRFRTLEDAHVFMAFTGLILRKSMELKLEGPWVQECLLLANSLMSLQNLEQTEQDWHHLTLAACFKHFEQMCNGFETDIQSASPEFYKLWIRDKKLFTIAAKARITRENKAKAALLA